MTTGRPSPIVVLGMQRSGTSALSAALSRLGVSFGSEEMLYPADGNNELGFYEHRKATVVNLKILDEFQMHVTSFTSLPANWKERPQSVELRPLLKGFLTTDFDHRERWGIKQPLTSLVVPIYNDVFDELGLAPHYIVCVRNPLEVMESESKLDFEGGYRVMQSLGTMAIGSWLRYTLGAIAGAAPNPVTIVAYDDLLSDPRGVIEPIVSTQPGWEPTDAQWTVALASIRTDLKHNRRPVSDLDPLPAIVRQTFESALIAARTQDPNLKRSEIQRLCQIYEEFLVWVQMLGDPAPPPGKLGLSWIRNGERCISEVAYLPEGRWQTVRLGVDAPPDTAVSGLIYGLPARIWIRNCVWRLKDGFVEAPIQCGPGSTISKVEGAIRFDVVFEPQQLRSKTPSTAGPYILEIEFLLETGSSIHLSAAARLAGQLEHCVSAVQALPSVNRS